MRSPSGPTRTQVRKGDGQPPYIVHPVTVALILSRYTSDEDTIIAGLLHDTLEDTLVTAEEIERAFGEKVRDMVLDVTEPDLPGPLVGDASKARYLRRLQAAPRPSLLVAGGRQDREPDLAHRGPRRVGQTSLWERFQRAARREARLLPQGPRADPRFLVRLPAAAGVRQPPGGSRAQAGRPHLIARRRRMTLPLSRLAAPAGGGERARRHHKGRDGHAERQSVASGQVVDHAAEPRPDGRSQPVSEGDDAQDGAEAPAAVDVRGQAPP